MDKRRDLLDGALTVFARDGYTRASIEVLAKAGGVSTRTIYNQFGDKATLFHAVIQDSAEQVAAAHIGMIHRYLTKIIDIEADLIEFARVWASPLPEFDVHFALVRQVHAEAPHIPPAALVTWQERGPLRVRNELAAAMRRIADAGHLQIEDAELAASHFTHLVSGDATSRLHRGADPLPAADIHRLSDAGVRAFLHGYGKR